MKESAAMKTEVLTEDEMNEKETPEAEAPDKDDSTQKRKQKPKRPTPSQKLKLEIERLEQQNTELNQRYLYLFAEFDNYRKRRQAESAEVAYQTQKNIILDLLPILDDTERLFTHNNENSDSVLSGSKLIADKLRTILSDLGVKPMDSKGKRFNPEYHEAIVTVDAPDTEPGIVVEVHEPGYFIGDKVLRYAKVIVSK